MNLDVKSTSTPSHNVSANTSIQKTIVGYSDKAYMSTDTVMYNHIMIFILNCDSVIVFTVAVVLHHQ